MKKTLYALSAAALLVTIACPVLNAAGKLDASLMKNLLLATTILWFIVWPAAIRGKAS
jgi:hypothetical protein